MLREQLSQRIGTKTKVAVVNVVLIASAFMWYFYAFNVLREVISTIDLPPMESLAVWGINFIGIAISAILGAILIDKIKRRFFFILIWMFAGIIFSLIPLIVDITTSTGLIIVSAIFGAYFGVGMPACMGYYASTTATEHRSKLGGLTFLSIGLGFFLLGIIGIENIATNAFILSTLRGFGLIILLLLRPEEKVIEKSDKVSFKFVISNRSFLLYFVPWFAFSIINYMTVPILASSFEEELARSFSVIENVLIGIFAVIGGVFADRFGRKRLAIVGFALLGLSYAILGFFPRDFSGGYIYVLYFYTFVDGITWGVLATIFLITIWGDLAHGKSSDKYYAIGALPYLLSNFMRILVGSYVGDAVSVNTVFSFAAFFLFLAILPLIYAPETLPEKHIRERELKSYIEKAQKEAAKAQQKEPETPQEEDDETKVELEANQKDYEEALKEAEKYY
jgi:MFS family permease